MRPAVKHRDPRYAIGEVVSNARVGTGGWIRTWVPDEAVRTRCYEFMIRLDAQVECEETAEGFIARQADESPKYNEKYSKER